MVFSCLCLDNSGLAGFCSSGRRLGEGGRVGGGRRLRGGGRLRGTSSSRGSWGGSKHVYLLSLVLVVIPADGLSCSGQEPLCSALNQGAVI